MTKKLHFFVPIDTIRNYLLLLFICCLALNMPSVNITLFARLCDLEIFIALLCLIN